MIDINNMGIAYSEVYEFIKIMGEDYKNKISNKVYQAIEDNRNKEYIPKIEIVDGNIKYNFSRESLALIAALNLQYWCNDEGKRKLIEKYQQNEEKEKQKYSYENLFKSKPKHIEEHNEIIEYKENKIKKLINKIKEYIFKILKNKKD